MTQPTLVFLGASSDQAPSYRAARALGFRVIGIDAKPEAFAFRFADETLNISVRNHAEIREALKGRDIDGFYSQASDAARLSEYELTRAFGTKRQVSMKSVLASSDKAFFIAALKAAGLPYQRQVSGSTRDALKQAVADWAPPFVIKPNDASGSKGVKTIAGLDAFDDAFFAAKEFSPTGTVLCEELIEGRHVSVDAFIRGGTPEFMTVSGKVMTQAPLMVPLHYTMPADISESERAGLEASVRKVCDALEIEAGPITCDVVLKDNGEAYFIEMGARAGGNAISLMMERAYAPDFVSASVALSAGRHIPVKPKHRRHAGLVTLASRRSGRFLAVKGLEDLERDGTISEYELFFAPGQEIEALTDGSMKLGYTIFDADSADDLRKKMNSAMQTLRIEVRAGDRTCDLALL